MVEESVIDYEEGHECILFPARGPPTAGGPQARHYWPQIPLARAAVTGPQTLVRWTPTQRVFTLRRTALSGLYSPCDEHTARGAMGRRTTLRSLIHFMVLAPFLASGTQKGGPLPSYDGNGPLSHILVAQRWPGTRSKGRQKTPAPRPASAWRRSKWPRGHRFRRRTLPGCW